MLAVGVGPAIHFADPADYSKYHHSPGQNWSVIFNGHIDALSPNGIVCCQAECISSCDFDFADDDADGGGGGAESFDWGGTQQQSSGASSGSAGSGGGDSSGSGGSDANGDDRLNVIDGKGDKGKRGEKGEKGEKGKKAGKGGKKGTLAEAAAGVRAASSIAVWSGALFMATVAVATVELRRRRRANRNLVRAAAQSVSPDLPNACSLFSRPLFDSCLRH